MQAYKPKGGPLGTDLPNTKFLSALGPRTCGRSFGGVVTGPLGAP